MTRIGDIGEAAPAIGDFLVLGEDVGDQREGAQVLLEGLGERIGGRLALGRARILHQAERGLDRQRLGPDLETQAGDGLVEQPVPTRISGDRLLVEQLLDAILELIGLLLADVLEPGPVMTERGILHGRVELGIVDAVELEHEEQQVRGCCGDPLLHVGIELGALGIDGVPGMDQAGEGHQPAKKLVERFVALDRLGQRRSRIGLPCERRELAFVILLERDALGIGAIEILLDRGIIDAGIEIV